MKIGYDFYARDPLTVAKDLIGKVLVRRLNGVNLAGVIVETEAYLGSIDKACHAYGGRRTLRTEIMYGKPGFAYIYFIYGLYYCLNFVTSPEGVADVVLIRAIQPLAFNLDGKIFEPKAAELMSQNRYKKAFNLLTKNQLKNFTNGPSKLCMALKLDKGLNGEDLCGNQLWVEDRVGSTTINSLFFSNMMIN